LKNVSRFWRDSSSRNTKILATGIHLVFRGLKSEYDEEIGQKGDFCEGLRMVFQKINDILYLSLSPLEGEGAIKNPNVQWMGS
jgi:hypothetical protein